jgi:hypothetical protein
VRQTGPPEKGDFCYVDLTARGTYEGKVLSAGKDYTVQLRESDEIVEAPNSEVWTAPMPP